MSLQGVGRDEQLSCKLAQRARSGQHSQDRKLPVGQRFEQPLLPCARRLGALFFGQPRGDEGPWVGAMPQDTAGLTYQRLRVDVGRMVGPGVRADPACRRRGEQCCGEFYPPRGGPGLGPGTWPQSATC